MKSILCYGDSNTFGARPVEFDLLEKSVVLAELRYPDDVRWTGVMQKELGEDYKVIEEGLCARTSTLDDPIEGLYKNGKSYLQPCLETHAPIDLVVLMLGTNDLKYKYNLSAFDIGLSITVLLDIISKSTVSREGKSPKILLVCPPPIGKLGYLKELFTGSVEKSKELVKYFEKAAKLFGCDFIDAGSIIKTSDLDGVHFDATEHERLGKSLAGKIIDIL